MSINGASEIPSSLLKCQPDPAPPGPNATQRDVAAYIVKLRGTSQNCRGQLNSVGKLTGQFAGQTGKKITR